MEIWYAAHSQLIEIISVIVVVLSCMAGAVLGYKRTLGWGVGLVLGFGVPVLGPVLVFFSAKKETGPVKLEKYISLLDDGLIDEAEYDILKNSLSDR